MEVAEEYFPCLVLKFFFTEEIWKHLKMYPDYERLIETLNQIVDFSIQSPILNTTKNGILEITFHLVSLILELPMMKIFTLLFESKNSSIHILYQMILTEICGIWSRITKKLLIVFLIMCNSFRITP